MFQNVTESLAIGNLTSQEDLTELYQKGYRTVIDLCTPAEPNQLNEDEVKNIGFNYIRIPVNRQDLKQETIQEFIQTVNNTHEPVYTRCASGFRAGVLTLLTLAQREGFTEEEYSKRLQALKLEHKPDCPLKAWVHEYFVSSLKA